MIIFAAILNHLDIIELKNVLMTASVALRYRLPFMVLAAIALISLIPVNYTTLVPEGILTEVNHADTSWLLMASALVLLMTPGLAFFYGGMVRYKNLVSTLLQSFIALGIISVLWIVIGFSLAFGDSIGGIYLSMHPWHTGPGIPKDFCVSGVYSTLQAVP